MEANIQFSECSECGQPFTTCPFRLPSQGLHYRLILFLKPEENGRRDRLKRWVEECPLFNSIRVAWISLCSSDNNPQEFFADLILALKKLQPEIEEGLSLDLVERDLVSLEVPMVELINWLAAESAETILILDHYEIIQSVPIHEAVQLLLDYLPPQVHLVIASSSEPPLQLARFRVRRQMLEFE